MAYLMSAIVGAGMNRQSALLPAGVKYHESLAKSWRLRYTTPAFQRRLALFRELIGTHAQSGQRWLDAGCGSGVLTDELSLVGAHGHAIDASPEMICAAVGLERGMSKPYSFEFKTIGTIERLDYDDGEFDGVLCSSVVEYLDEPIAAMRELRRVLSPHGILLASFPNSLSMIRNIQSAVRRICMLFDSDVFPYIEVSKHAYSRSMLVHMLGCVDFAVQSIHTFDPIIPERVRAFVPPAMYVVVASPT